MNKSELKYELDYAQERAEIAHASAAAAEDHKYRQDAGLIRYAHLIPMELLKGVVITDKSDGLSATVVIFDKRVIEALRARRDEAPIFDAVLHGNRGIRFDSAVIDGLISGVSINTAYGRRS